MTTELRRLLAEATPGPWVEWSDMIRAPNADDRMVCESVYGADRALIAAAVNALPGYLAFVDEVLAIHGEHYGYTPRGACGICDALDRLDGAS
jgi:hypothetical protein